MEVAAGGGFVLAVPMYSQFNPRTGRGWEGTGVEPDVAVAAERALDVAHCAAVKKLAAGAGAARQRQLDWLVPLLELQATGPQAVPESALRRYAGTYDGIEILLDQGRLFFLGASGVRRNLLAFSPAGFVIEDASVPAESQARVRFVTGPDGGVSGLDLLVADGRIIPRARTPRS